MSVVLAYSEERETQYNGRPIATENERGPILYVPTNPKRIEFVVRLLEGYIAFMEIDPQAVRFLENFLATSKYILEQMEKGTTEVRVGYILGDGNSDESKTPEEVASAGTWLMDSWCPSVPNDTN